MEVVTTYLICGLRQRGDQRALIQRKATSIEELAKELTELEDAGVMFASVWFAREVKTGLSRGRVDGG